MKSLLLLTALSLPCSANRDVTFDLSRITFPPKTAILGEDTPSISRAIVFSSGAIVGDDLLLGNFLPFEPSDSMSYCLMYLTYVLEIGGHGDDGTLIPAGDLNIPRASYSTRFEANVDLDHSEGGGLSPGGAGGFFTRGEKFTGPLRPRDFYDEPGQDFQVGELSGPRLSRVLISGFTCVTKYNSNTPGFNRETADDLDKMMSAGFGNLVHFEAR